MTEDASKSTKWMELELTAILVDTWDGNDDDCVVGNGDEDEDTGFDGDGEHSQKSLLTRNIFWLSWRQISEPEK